MPDIIQQATSLSLYPLNPSLFSSYSVMAAPYQEESVQSIVQLGQTSFGDIQFTSGTLTRENLRSLRSIATLMTHSNMGTFPTNFTEKV